LNIQIPGRHATLCLQEGFLQIHQTADLQAQFFPILQQELCKIQAKAISFYMTRKLTERSAIVERE
jgi:hypothetical protein